MGFIKILKCRHRIQGVHMAEFLTVDDKPEVKLPITSKLLSSAVGLFRDYTLSVNGCEECKLSPLCKRGFGTCPRGWKKEEVLHDVDC